MPYDASSRKDVRKAEKQSKLAQSTDDLVLATLLDTAGGREYIWNRLGSVFVSPFSIEPSATAFNCGIQSVAIDLLQAAVRVSPTNFIQALHEANIRTATNDRRNSPATERSSEPDSRRDDQGPSGADYEYDPLDTDDHGG